MIDKLKKSYALNMTLTLGETDKVSFPTEGPPWLHQGNYHQREWSTVEFQILRMDLLNIFLFDLKTLRDYGRVARGTMKTPNKLGVLFSCVSHERNATEV